MPKLVSFSQWLNLGFSSFYDYSLRSSLRFPLKLFFSKDIRLNYSIEKTFSTILPSTLDYLKDVNKSFFKKLLMWRFSTGKIKKFKWYFQRRVKKFFFRRTSKLLRRFKLKWFWKKIMNFVRYFKLKTLKNIIIKKYVLFWVLNFRAKYFKRILKRFNVLFKFNLKRKKIKKTTKIEFPQNFIDSDFYCKFAEDFISYTDFEEYNENKSSLAWFRSTYHGLKWRDKKMRKDLEKFTKSLSFYEYFLRLRKGYWYKKFYRNYKNFKYSKPYKDYMDYKSFGFYYTYLEIEKLKKLKLVKFSLFERFKLEAKKLYNRKDYRKILEWFKVLYSKKLYKNVRSHFNHFVYFHNYYYEKFTKNYLVYFEFLKDSKMKARARRRYRKNFLEKFNQWKEDELKFKKHQEKLINIKGYALSFMLKFKKEFLRRFCIINSLNKQKNWRIKIKGYLRTKKLIKIKKKKDKNFRFMRLALKDLKKNLRALSETQFLFIIVHYLVFLKQLLKNKLKYVFFVLNKILICFLNKYPISKRIVFKKIAWYKKSIKNYRKIYKNLYYLYQNVIEKNIDIREDIYDNAYVYKKTKLTVKLFNPRRYYFYVGSFNFDQLIPRYFWKNIKSSRFDFAKIFYGISNLDKILDIKKIIAINLKPNLDIFYRPLNNKNYLSILASRKDRLNRFWNYCIKNTKMLNKGKRYFYIGFLRWVKSYRLPKARKFKGKDLFWVYY